MKKITILYSSFLLACCALSADVTPNDDLLQTTFELSQGYRRDNLDVKTDIGKHKNAFHRRQHFKHIDIYSNRLGVTLSKNSYFLTGIAGYGQVNSGKFNVSAAERDLHDVNRVHQKSHIHDGYTADFSLTFGKNILLANDWFIAPTLGYGVYRQKFDTSRGKRRVLYTDAFGDRHRRHSRGIKEDFKATWYSPQLGLNLTKAFTENLRAFVNYAFLFPLNYQAKAHFNSRSKAVTKYQQENKAYKSFGHIGTVGMEWKFANGWSLTPEFELMKFYSKAGDSAHHLNLKKVDRTASEVRLTLGYSF